MRPLSEKKNVTSTMGRVTIASTMWVVSSGKYIDRMSDYCRHCQYKVKEAVGDDACPFNYLYWNFLIENERTLSGNQRMSLIYASLGRMDPAKRQAMTDQAQRFLTTL